MSFRFNNDLLLWEPVAPSPLPTQDQASGSIQPFDLSCYPQVLQDNFELAKSAIQYGMHFFLEHIRLINISCSCTYYHQN